MGGDLAVLIKPLIDHRRSVGGYSGRLFYSVLLGLEAGRVDDHILLPTYVLCYLIPSMLSNYSCDYNAVIFMPLVGC